VTQRPQSMVIDDLSKAPPLAANGAKWGLFTDQVMGGVSQATMVREIIAGRTAIRIRGDVSLENNGGFVQIALDVSPSGEPLDVSEFDGIEIDVFGNSERYGLHLRTADMTRPWQSYRQIFRAADTWQTVHLPFAGFEAHRIDVQLNHGCVRRIGLVAIGRAFAADLSLGRIAFYTAQWRKPTWGSKPAEDH